MTGQPTADAFRALTALTTELERLGLTRIAFTGGIAVGVWTTPRLTRDFDLCAVVPEIAVDKLLALHDGIRVGPGRLPAIIRFEFQGWGVDVFVASTEFDEQCLTRALEELVLGVKIRVVTPEDLLIHKLIKLRDDKRKLLHDAADIVALLKRDLDWTYLRRWLPELKAEWMTAELATDESQLVDRLKSLG